ncbi:L,D-transpeptidase family protein [Microlunatus soli]|uniref:L,D-peptidoglycan transpeptidase YkuD, ErfK/YbiS/YcfS/YnhG family n=1 Tax=Microlunatus soli TaxID=630515 RepID=A0A1H1P3A1_9ACTN|nr:L,D-transpeptidase family protein [Microlunatus soli]SDS05746.1 L,D-peptidoglycan transpeptidase YkuD, ErfK/YbiS/YcfS/YnhG family [Microlunatus soli]
MRKLMLIMITGLTGIALGSSLFAAPGAQAADISAGSPNYGKGWVRCNPTLNGVKTTVGANQRTVTVVNQRSKTYADTGFYVRVNGKRCTLHRLFLATKSRLGYGGTVAGTKRRQGTGTTPRGTYSITSAFGLKADPGSWVPYHRVKSGDYWVEDNGSRYYNTLRNRSAGGFRYWLPTSDANSSERLTDYPGQYDYALVINYNRPPNAVRYRGAGIFLHVKGDGATAGCVSISRTNMRIALAYLRSGDKIVITS